MIASPRMPRLWTADWSLYLGHTEKGLSVNWAVHNFGNDSARVEIDLASIVRHASQRRAATVLADRRVVLSGHTERGGRLDAWVDPSRPGTYSRLDATLPDGTVIAEILVSSVNEPVPPDAFRFPRFAERLRIPAPTPLTIETMGEGLKQVGTAMLLHAGFVGVFDRQEIEAKLGRPLDWPTLQAAEAAVAPLLQKALKEDSSLSPP